MMDDSERSAREDGWVVVWTESRAERKVGARIAAQGIEQWVPTITERHRWSDRWKDVAVPLFPGYVFVRARSTQASGLLRVPGVLTLVRAGDKPAQLSDSFIRSLRSALETTGIAARACEPHESHDYSIDDEVVVQEGPLVGLRGVVAELRSGRQLVIWVRQIGRGVAFRIGSSLVSPCAA